LGNSSKNQVNAKFGETKKGFGSLNRLIKFQIWTVKNFEEAAIERLQLSQNNRNFHDGGIDNQTFLGV